MPQQSEPAYRLAWGEQSRHPLIRPLGCSSNPVVVAGSVVCYCQRAWQTLPPFSSKERNVIGTPNQSAVLFSSGHSNQTIDTIPPLKEQSEDEEKMSAMEDDLRRS